MRPRCGARIELSDRADHLAAWHGDVALLKHGALEGGLLRGQAPYAETPYEARSRAQAEDKLAIGEAAKTGRTVATE